MLYDMRHIYTFVQYLHHSIDFYRNYNNIYICIVYIQDTEDSIMCRDKRHITTIYSRWETFDALEVKLLVTIDGTSINPFSSP